MLHVALFLALMLEPSNRCSDVFFQNSWELLAEARYGESPFEQAAWAVAEADGRITFVRWPFNHGLCEARFKGRIPRNAFAIVHTHPNGHIVPSEVDRDTAKRLAMRVYVVTRNALTRTDGSRSEYVLSGDWNPARCARP